MAIRLRQTGAGLIAICAARSVAKEGDIYLDDAAHGALSLKFDRDFAEMGLSHRSPSEFYSPPDEGVEDIRAKSLAMDAEESNNANRTEWDKEYGNAQ